MTTELTSKQIERQDYVDGHIEELLASLNPTKREIEYNIEHIGTVRDAVQEVIVDRLKLCSEMKFYPFIKTPDEPKERKLPKNMVTILVELDERNGEREYRQNYLTTCKRGHEDAAAERVAREWYSGKPVRDGDCYIFDYGEVMVWVNGWVEVPPEHATILKQYRI